MPIILIKFHAIHKEVRENTGSVLSSFNIYSLILLYKLLVIRNVFPSKVCSASIFCLNLQEKIQSILVHYIYLEN